jgi:hypothetical protein
MERGGNFQSEEFGSFDVSDELPQNDHLNNLDPSDYYTVMNVVS